MISKYLFYIFQSFQTMTFKLHVRNKYLMHTYVLTRRQHRTGINLIQFLIRGSHLCGVGEELTVDFLAVGQDHTDPYSG